MSHIKYNTGEKDKERWSIDRENMKKCVVNKCPYFSWGTCLKAMCMLFPKNRNLKIVK